MMTTKAKLSDKAQVKAAVNAIVALAEAIREVGEIPSGQLYAVVMGQMDLETYESFIGRLTSAGLVTKRGNVLVWTGPLA